MTTGDFILPMGLILIVVVPISLLAHLFTEHFASVNGLIKDLTNITLPQAIVVNHTPRSRYLHANRVSVFPF